MFNFNFGWHRYGSCKILLSFSSISFFCRPYPFLLYLARHTTTSKDPQQIICFDIACHICWSFGFCVDVFDDLVVVEDDVAFGSGLSLLLSPVFFVVLVEAEGAGAILEEFLGFIVGFFAGR